MASTSSFVPRRALIAVTAAAVACVLLVGAFAPGAVGKAPSCALSNTRTHKDYASLQEAVTAAKAGDTIEIKGRCLGSTTIDKDIALSGVTNKTFPDPATLDGNRQGRVLTITGGSVKISNLTITGGLTAASGGGIYLASTAALSNVLVTGNQAGATMFGGGIEADLGSTLTLSNSTVSGNSAGGSGGIDMFRATASLTNSTVSGNQATRSPGTEPDGCLFDDVLYSCAGGIWNYQGTLALVNTTVSGNSAAYRGGGIVTYVRLFADGAPRSGLTVLSGATSVTANSAPNSGGGIFLPAPVASPLFGVRAADGSSTYTDPVTGATLPAWTGAVSGNTPDQCSPALTLGGGTCGA